jgi:hypothetical protein
MTNPTITKAKVYGKRTHFVAIATPEAISNKVINTVIGNCGATTGGGTACNNIGMMVIRMDRN